MITSLAGDVKLYYWRYGFFVSVVFFLPSMTCLLYFVQLIEVSNAQLRATGVCSQCRAPPVSISLGTLFNNPVLPGSYR